jgi:hypothetical protein
MRGGEGPGGSGPNIGHPPRVPSFSSKKPAIAAGFLVRRAGGVEMSRRQTRNGVLMIIAGLWLVGFTTIVAARRPEEPILTVVHWTNGHMMRPGLLPQMAEQFNAAHHTTQTGQRIVVQVFNDGSAEQVDDLISRASRGVPLNQKLPDPVIVTPSADHWLVR